MAKIDLKLESGVTDTPPTGYVRFYAKADKILYYKDDTGAETQVAPVTTEQIQDVVGGLLTDSSSVDVTYNDAGNALTLTVIASAVNHDALLNFVANEHIDHSTVSITAGTSLNGGGTIAANRTINHNTFGTAGTYGSATTIPVITTETTGHITGVTSTPISIPSSQVSNFGSSVLGTILSGFAAVAGTVTSADNILQAFQKLQGTITAGLASFASDVLNTILTGYSVGADVAVAASDSILQAIQKLQGQIDAINSSALGWTELRTTADIIVNSNTTLTSVTELQFTATAGRVYYMEYTIKFRTAATTTGFAVTLGTSNGAAGSIACQVNLPIGADGTAALYTGSITALADVVTSTAVPTIQPDWYICNIKGTFNCTTGGIILPQFRSEVNLSNVNFGTASIALIREFA